VMRGEKGAEIQTRHDRFSCLCPALIPIDRAWSTRRLKNSENRAFWRRQPGLRKKPHAVSDG
jgi:hypothetical protein